MRHNQPGFSPPTKQLTQNFQTISQNGQALGYLDAMDLIAKLPTSTGHPVEAETIDRIYGALERGYSERFRRCDYVG
ncbi:hypothetical protein DSCW_43320 [Desulfosarcina widdelii]|uniref:Uncharacterized protein n=1 Tax=Desulfosarcina widdelii TaxID=947919 RepID=A0A5K7Z8A0_9BACT|nr:hypothetical protein [Desulfosarcina widdelii]BBO76915.1 hypothetical protein DSCW_43320 [Desulfosarcina widdelii]